MLLHPLITNMYGGFDITNDTMTRESFPFLIDFILCNIKNKKYNQLKIYLVSMIMKFYNCVHLMSPSFCPPQHCLPKQE